MKNGINRPYCSPLQGIYLATKTTYEHCGSFCNVFKTAILRNRQIIFCTFFRGYMARNFFPLLLTFAEFIYQPISQREIVEQTLIRNKKTELKLENHPE